MKKRKIGEYLSKNGIVLRNTETGDEFIRYISESTNLIFRSMLEDDLERVSKKKGLTNKEKRFLLKKLREAESESAYYILEELHHREIDGCRVIVATAELNNEQNITVDVFLADQKNKMADQFAKKSILLRVSTLVDEFYHKTNADGRMKINRIA